MLFEEYKYFDYQFPEPQYLGAKHTQKLVKNSLHHAQTRRPQVSRQHVKL